MTESDHSALKASAHTQQLGDPADPASPKMATIPGVQRLVLNIFGSISIHRSGPEQLLSPP